MRLQRLQQPDGRVRLAALPGLAALLAAGLVGGCSSSSLSGATGSTDSTPSLSQRFSQLFSSGSTVSQSAAENTAATPSDIDCPTVEVRNGASTYAVNSESNDPSALGLRYQASIGQTARSCAVRAGALSVKLGIQGRVIVGPAGAPSQIDVPMRFAVVREGPEPKPVWTKFYKIPVSMPPGQGNVEFTHIEEDISFPMPSAADLEAYVIYIGFDPQGMRPEPRGRRQAPRR